MPTRYGIVDSRDLIRTVQQIGERNLATAITQYLNQYNAAFNEFLGEYAALTTEYKERYYTGVAAGRMRPSDEYSRGLMSRPPVPTYFDVAYPLSSVDDRLGWTQTVLAKLTGQRLQEQFNVVNERDRNTMLAGLYSAVFYSGNWTFSDDEWGDLTITRLLNNDGTVPPPYQNRTFAGTHNHYLSTGGALTATFLGTVYEHLREHGNGVDVVLEVARNVGNTISGLTGFYRAEQAVDGRINYNATTQPESSTVTNARAIGRIQNMEIRVNDTFPDNYGFATDLGSEPPIVMRQDPEAELQGLRLVQDSPNDNYPLRNAFFQRRVGFGVRNRTNGVMFIVDAGGAYIDPPTL